MIRTLLLVCVASCGSAGASFKPATLPDLVAAKPAEHPLASRELLLVPGEHMIYEVHLHGITVGKFEMEVGETEVTSHFQTDSLAAAFANAHHDLSTVLDRATASTTIASESLVIGEETKHFDYDGKNGQTVHTALGLLRSWVASDAAPGFLIVQELGHPYRLAVKRPTVEDLQGTKTFRVDASVNTKSPMTIQIWFATTPDRKPLKFEIVNDDFHVTANLIPT
ncbi:MAG: hypothetical protein ABI591_02320 [Kofleriaceae bacterium]